MVDFKPDTNIHKIIDSTSGAKSVDEEWFTEDIAIKLSPGRGVRLILDFGYVESSIIEIKRDGPGNTYVPINGGNPFVGEQNLLVPVFSGDVINFRAKSAVTLSHASFGEV